MIGFQSIHDARRVIRAARKTEQLQLRDTRRLRNRHAVRPGQRWIPFKNTLGRDLPPHSMVRLVDEDPTEQDCVEGRALLYSIENAGDGGWRWRDGVTNAHSVNQDTIGWMTLDFPARCRCHTGGETTLYDPPRIGESFGPWWKSDIQSSDSKLPALMRYLGGFRCLGDVEPAFTNVSPNFHYIALFDRDPWIQFRGKTVNSIAAGEEGDVDVYQEDDTLLANPYFGGITFRLTARNNFADLANNRWVECTQIDDEWHITAGEC